MQEYKTKEDTWKAWYNMIDRCTNEKCKDYPYYGGRCISVCDRWLIFENFLNDMGTAPKGKSIDRINSNGDYEPLNCRWATKIEQNQNRSFNVKGYTYNKYHNKYEAKIKKDGKKIFLGYFGTKKEAQAAYLKAKRENNKIAAIPEVVRRLHNVWDRRLSHALP
jgi:hypothetical protein